jgi:hypothetical protein
MLECHPNLFRLHVKRLLWRRDDHLSDALEVLNYLSANQEHLDKVKDRWQLIDIITDALVFSWNGNFYDFRKDLLDDYFHPMTPSRKLLLYPAAEADTSKCLDKISEHYSVYPSMAVIASNHLLCVAAFMGDQILVEKLLQGDRLFLLFQNRTFNLSPLTYAASQGHTHIVRLFLNRLSKVFPMESVDQKSILLPHLFAIRSGQVEVMKVICEFGHKQFFHWNDYHLRDSINGNHLKLVEQIWKQSNGYQYRDLPRSIYPSDVRKKDLSSTVSCARFIFDLAAFKGPDYTKIMELAIACGAFADFRLFDEHLLWKLASRELCMPLKLIFEPYINYRGI